jgi:hypothetical protein
MSCIAVHHEQVLGRGVCHNRCPYPDATSVQCNNVAHAVAFTQHPQVTSALSTMVRDAPLSNTLLSQINESLKELENSLQTRAQSNQPLAPTLSALVQATLEAVNETTQVHIMCLSIATL